MLDFAPYIGIVILIAFSAFFSGSEISYASVNPLRLKNAADNGSKRAEIAYLICQHYDKALCTILIGNNLVNIAASSVATVIAIQLAGDGGAVVATAIMTVIILIFGEIMPKMLAKEHCDSFTVLVSPFLRGLMWITKPLVAGITWLTGRIARLWGGAAEPEPLTTDELVTMIETGEDEGIIDEQRSDLLQSAVSFRETTVEEVLTPRVDLLAIDLQDSEGENRAIMDASPYSRIPVYEEDLDHITGILYLNHAYRVLAEAPDTAVHDLIMPAFFLHKSACLPVALQELRRRNLQMAVVLDDFGGTCGVVTLEDILEELVGDIWDETDAMEPEFQQLSDCRYRVSGSMSLGDLLEEFDLDALEDDFESTTVGGWVVESLGGFPAVGDSFTWETLTVTVETLDDLRVIGVLVDVCARNAQADD